MLTVLNDAIKSLNIHYVFLFACALVILFFKRKKFALYILLISLFAITWRSAYKLSTTRYVCFFLILAPLTIILVLYKTKIYRMPRTGKWITYGIAALFVIVNSHILFSSYRNLYVFDIKEEFDREREQKDYNHMIISKGHKRLYEGKQSDNIKVFSSDIDSDKIIRAYEYYFLFRKDTVIIKKEREKKALTPFQSINPVITSRRFFHFYTSKQKKDYYSFFLIKEFSPSFLKEIDPLLEKLVNNGQLKTLSLKNDTYIFQLNNELYWVIGEQIDQKTEIIYHVLTNKPNLLKENRQKYGYDNLGFQANSSKMIKRCGKYIVYKSAIPDSYPIKLIRTGFLNPNEKIQWFPFFSPSPD